MTHSRFSANAVRQAETTRPTARFRISELGGSNLTVHSNLGVLFCQKTRNRIRLINGFGALHRGGFEKLPSLSAFTDKFGGTNINEAVCETLYRFCQVMKVCVEMVLMAANVQLVPVDIEVIAIAGSGEGADTAVVVKPSYPMKFHELKIKEITAKPRDP